MCYFYEKRMCDVSVTVLETKCMDQLKKNWNHAQSQLNLLMGKIAQLFEKDWQFKYVKNYMYLRPYYF